MQGTEVRDCELCGTTTGCRPARMPGDSWLWLCVKSRNGCFERVKRLYGENDEPAAWPSEQQVMDWNEHNAHVDGGDW